MEKREGIIEEGPGGMGVSNNNERVEGECDKMRNLNKRAKG